ncbi:XkdQ/YqbQ family protein [Clostridium kluyveri]|uniref:YqbQ/XkdQ domain-containing protein n=2 Tax=Clostridium kluyveri TaxID=1534 RepID=A5N2A9_CLOK5|nr:hypothetical protein [Clostridium kluyveri]EDK35255.1 Conserved hypothetical protein [Clostridium kluyveri DSM 555]BAH07929.1 hypothetical protein CKR_2878 [Clostridium kluyveri NBRC 12016]
MISIIAKDNYKIGNLNEGITLQESIDSIAYVATVKLLETEQLQSIQFVKGNGIEIWDTPFNGTSDVKVFKGVVWERERNRKEHYLNLECKERTVYLENSEDEYLHPEGQTATQRITKYANDWNIPIGNFADTGIGLAKNIYRGGDTILDMIFKDLKETAQKGGKLYKVRMQEDKLDLVEIGTNTTVWKLESIAEEIEEYSSLEGAVTQVKVLGTQSDESLSPVIGIYEKETRGYGTLRKIVQDDKVTNADAAKKKADSIFSTGEDYINISCGVDINTIRAGDKVSLDGVELYVASVTHTLGSSGKMELTVGTMDYIRRKFYAGDTGTS